MTPPELFFGMLPNPLLPLSVDFVVKPSEALKAYASAAVKLGNSSADLTFNHKIVSSDGDLYSVSYDFTSDGSGLLILSGTDLSNNETIDTIPFSGYRILRLAPLFAFSPDGSISLKVAGQLSNRGELIVSYTPQNIATFERFEWEIINSPCRFITSARIGEGRFELLVKPDMGISSPGTSLNVVLFQLQNQTWLPLNTWYSPSRGVFMAYPESLGVFLAAAGPDDAGLQASVLPSQHNLHQNVPNPFNANTMLAFEIGEGSSLYEAHVRIEVFNILGQKINTLVDDNLPPGQHMVRWDGSNMSGRCVSTGVYFARLLVGGESSTIKMVYMK